MLSNCNLIYSIHNLKNETSLDKFNEVHNKTPIAMHLCSINVQHNTDFS